MEIEILLNSYGTYIYNYALKLSCHPTTAEDLAQETFIKAWENLEQLQNPDAIKSWLRKICLNIFLMKARKENKYTEIPYEEIDALAKEGYLLTDSSPSPEDEILVEEAIRDLQNGCFLAMARRLTLHQRIAFSLTDMFGLPLDEVAPLIGVSTQAAKGLLYRARMNLDSFFDNHCNLIDTANPCSCQAWIAFSKSRNNLQKEAKEHHLVTSLDYTQSNYTFNVGVRNKINYLYQNMPNKKPSSEWYQNVITLTKEMYIVKNKS